HWPGHPSQPMPFDSISVVRAALAPHRTGGDPMSTAPGNPPATRAVHSRQALLRPGAPSKEASSMPTTTPPSPGLPLALTIRVLPWDIEHGRAGDRDSSPVALAARRLLRQEWPGADACVTSRLLLAWLRYADLGARYS